MVLNNLVQGATHPKLGPQGRNHLCLSLLLVVIIVDDDHVLGLLGCPPPQSHLLDSLCLVHVHRHYGFPVLFISIFQLPHYNPPLLL